MLHASGVCVCLPASLETSFLKASIYAVSNYGPAGETPLVQAQRKTRDRVSSDAE